MTATTAEIDRWVGDVTRCVRDIAGEWAAEAGADWDRHCARPRVCVTVYGSYDSGKSSLLKRFLVTDGTPVPDWLIIGAKPTSDAIDEVDSGGLTWIDTPGFAAGNDQHETLAHRSIVLTDALLVVLPPQMLNTDIGRITGLVDGSFYNPAAPGPLFPRGALTVAVAQMDKAGIDPRDDLDGYREIVEEKRSELISSLARHIGAEPAITLHLISADPRQVGRRAVTAAADYAGRESWDGVAELRAGLDVLTDRRAELRSGAAVRYWSWIGSRARGGAEDELARLVEAADEARRRQTSIRLIHQELVALDKVARARLQEMNFTDLTAARGDDAEALRTYLDDLCDADALKPAEPDAPALQHLLDRFEQHAKTAARAGYKLFNGLSADAARTELAHLRFLDATHLDRYYKNSESLLTSAKQVDAVRRRLQQLEFFEETLPIVAELGCVLVSGYLEHRGERPRVELRAELRTQAEKIAKSIVDGGHGVQAWSDAVKSFHESLDATEVPADVVAESTKRGALLREAVARLTVLLECPPGRE